MSRARADEPGRAGARSPRAAAATAPRAATRRRRPAARRAPRAYTKAFQAFDKKFPWVKTYSAWNEINHKSQPTFKSPKPAAQLLQRAAQDAPRGKFRVMAADMLDTGNMSPLPARRSSAPPRARRSCGACTTTATSTAAARRHAADAAHRARRGVADRDRRHRQARCRASSARRRAPPRARRACSSWPTSTTRKRRAYRSKITRLFVYTWYGEDRERALRRRPREPGRLAPPGVQRVQEERGQAPLGRAPAGILGARRSGPPARIRGMDLCLMIEGQEGVSWETGSPSPRRARRTASRPCSAPTTTSTSAATPSAARSTPGRRSPRCRRHDARSGSARWSPPPRSAIPASWPRTSSPPTTSPAAASSSASAPAGTSASTRAYGFPFPPLRERMDMLAEQLEIVHGQWTRAPFSFSGEHYRLRGPRRAAAGRCSAAPAAADGRRGRPAQRRARRPLGRRVQHRRSRRSRSARAQGAGRRRVRGGGPRADPVLADDRVLVGRDREELRERAAALAEHARGRRRVRRARRADRGWIVGTVDEVAERLGALRDAGVRPRDAPAPAAHRPRRTSS